MQTVQIWGSKFITIWALTTDNGQRKQLIQTIKEKEPPAFLNSCASSFLDCVSEVPAEVPPIFFFGRSSAFIVACAERGTLEASMAEYLLVLI